MTTEIGVGAGAGVEAGGNILPGGWHPQDRGGPDPNPVGQDRTDHPEPRHGRAAFSTSNGQAVAVFQRAGAEFAEDSFTFSSQTPSSRLVGRQRGRVSVTIWVPSTASEGVQWSRLRSKVDFGQGLQLNVGDSVTIGSEAPVYAGLQSGQTTGEVYVLDVFNPPVAQPD